MHDELWIALTDDGRLRVRAARTTELVREAVRRQRAGRLAKVALARALSTAAVFPLEEGKLSLVALQIVGAGPLGSVLVEHRFPGSLRGYVANPDAVPRGEIAYQRRGAGLGLLPSAYLTVVKQDGFGHNVVGRIALENGEIDEDVQAYFQKSEQLPTRVFADVRLDDEGEVAFASGALVQAVPPGSAQDLEGFQPPASASLDEIVRDAACGRAVHVVRRERLAFRCDCSLERVRSGLMMIDLMELRDMLERDKGAEVICRFCGGRYFLDEAGLRSVMTERMSRHTGEVGEA